MCTIFLRLFYVLTITEGKGRAIQRGERLNHLKNNSLSSLLRCLYKLLPALPASTCLWLMKMTTCGCKTDIIYEGPLESITYTCRSDYDCRCKLINNSWQTTRNKSTRKFANKNVFSMRDWGRLQGACECTRLSAGLLTDFCGNIQTQEPFKGDYDRRTNTGEQIKAEDRILFLNLAVISKKNIIYE